MDTQVDFSTMDAGEFYHHLSNSDASEWTRAFLHFQPECDIDPGILTGWFANCFMAGFDKAHGNPPLCGDHAEWLLGRG